MKNDCDFPCIHSKDCKFFEEDKTGIRIDSWEDFGIGDNGLCRDKFTFSNGEELLIEIPPKIDGVDITNDIRMEHIRNKLLYSGIKECHIKDFVKNAILSNQPGRWNRYLKEN